MGSDANHRSLMKNIDVESAHRHSPSASESGDTGTLRSMIAVGKESPGGSPNPLPSAVFPSAATGNLSSSPHTSRFGHRSRNSTDSVSSNAAIYGSGVPAEAAALLRNGVSLGDIIHASRRHGQDGGRPESSDRSAGTEPPGSAKEKSFLSFLSRKKKQKDDGSVPSPEDLESPTSPATMFKPNSLDSRPGNASEVSLERPGSGFSQDFGFTTASRPRTSTARNFVLATTDYWNYRMVDVTDIDTAADIRHLICINLGLPDSVGAQFYKTELGQSDHEDPWDDAKLLANKQLKADSTGTLKLFVRPPDALHPGLAANTGTQEALPDGHVSEAYALLNGQRRRSSSSPPTSRQNTINDREKDDKLLTSEATEYRAEQLRKQQEYLAKRKQAQNVRETASPDSASVGIVGRNVNFDQPRTSPFEDKKPDNLFPQRKAPAPPEDPSATLIKANSLSRKTGQGMRLSTGSSDAVYHHPKKSSTDLREEMFEKHRRRMPGPSPTGGIGGLLVGMAGRMAGVAHPVAGGSAAMASARADSSPMHNGKYQTVTWPRRGMFCHPFARLEGQREYETTY